MARQDPQRTRCAPFTSIQHKFSPLPPPPLILIFFFFLFVFVFFKFLLCVFILNAVVGGQLLTLLAELRAERDVIQRESAKSQAELAVLDQAEQKYLSFPLSSLHPALLVANWQ
jgi:hypothetical protein